MPFSSQEIIEAGKIGLDYFLKNNPIDQIKIERPLLKFLMEGKQSAPGAKQYIVEQLRYRYQSNFQWFNGAQVVTYNRRQSIEQAQYAWRSAHDGFALDEDRLAQNGIIINDDASPRSASGAERLQLTNLFEEQTSILRLGFEEAMGMQVHLDGTQSGDAITGLDGLITLTPTSGTSGTISRVDNVWWRNHAATGLTVTTTTGDVLDKMEVAWRQCVRNGGTPNKIIAGSDYIDGFRNFMIKTYSAGGGYVFNSERGLGKDVKAGTDMLQFHGVPIEWSPEFYNLDATFAPATPWEKRCYFLNSNHIKLRPLEGHDMVTRKPPRAYDKYEYYWGLTWRGATTVNRMNAHAVLAIA